MSTSEIKRLYDKKWTRVQIAEEIVYNCPDIEFKEAMQIVEEVLLRLQRRTIKC